jgi:hypothetical protein
MTNAIVQDIDLALQGLEQLAPVGLEIGGLFSPEVAALINFAPEIEALLKGIDTIVVQTGQTLDQAKATSAAHNTAGQPNAPALAPTAQPAA